MIAYFRDKRIDALGIACFGPIELDRDSEKLRLYHNHAKAGLEGLRYCWADAGGTSLPLWEFDTDVNGSVLGEVTFGQAQGKNVRHVSDHRYGCRRWYL